MSTDENMKHMEHLEAVLTRDQLLLEAGEKKYKASWKKRGGVDSFYMLARKWDRIEARVSQDHFAGNSVQQFNILEHCMADKALDGILDDIGDLRRYLALVEAEVRSRGVQF